MTNSVLLCVQTVLPLTIITMLGFLLKRARFFDRSFVEQAERLCFRVALPCGVFTNFQSIDLSKLTASRVVLFLLSAITVFTLLLIVIIPKIVHDTKIAGAMVQGMFRTNCLVQAVPMLENLYGEGNAALGLLALPFVVTLNNVLATILFAVLTAPDERQNRHSAGKIVIEVLKNPLILGCIAGALCSLVNISFPEVICNTLRQINRMGSALILLCMGARLHFRGLGVRLHYTVPTVAVRLIVMPAAITALAVLLGFRKEELSTVFLYISTSSASVGYIMAVSMGADGDIAAETICLSSIFSVFTVAAGLMMLLHWGWIP